MQIFDFNSSPVIRDDEIITSFKTVLIGSGPAVLFLLTQNIISTCLPIMLLELKEELGLEGKIAVTQPRRVAIRSVANRVSELMGCE